MNDPHVVSLIYRINKAETVDFDKAPPLRVDRGAFRVTVDAYVAKIEMVDHFASVKEARDVVEPFLRAWELEADLRALAERFRFVPDTAEVIDRNPTAGFVLHAQGAAFGVGGAQAFTHVGRATWPGPPQDLKVSPNVDVLWRRWRRCREEQREPLLSAAYWTLTMLEAAPGATAPAKPRPGSNRRQAASAFFNIELDVLNKIGELTSTRGGNDEERKAEGRGNPLSTAEKEWLVQAFRELIRRAAEQAYHGNWVSRRSG